MCKQFLAVAVATAAISGCAVAQTPKVDDAHSSHHPAGSALIAAAPAPTSRPTPPPEAFERQMKAMEEMHQKMQSAKTQAEREALMDEHMKLMHAGMGMMGQMRGTGGMPGMMGMHMERRMAMMEQMLRMMVDRLPPAR
jgi:hypothetical protein